MTRRQSWWPQDSSPYLRSLWFAGCIHARQRESPEAAPESVCEAADLLAMPRWTPDPDVEHFGPLIEEFLAAVTRDPAYAISMAERGAAIRHRRDLWQVRTELRQAEAEAIALCAAGEPAPCDSEAPCGVTAACRYSTGDLATVVVTTVAVKRRDVSGTRRPRPQLTSSGETSYSEVEPALRAVLAARVG